MTRSARGNTFVGAPGSVLQPRTPAGTAALPQLHRDPLPDLSHELTDADLSDLAYNAAHGPDFAALMASPGHVHALLLLVERLEHRVQIAEDLALAAQQEALRFRQIDADRCAELLGVRNSMMELWFRLTSAGGSAVPLARQDFEDDEVVVSHTMEVDLPPPLPPPPARGSKDSL